MITSSIRDRVFKALITEYDTKREKGEALDLPTFDHLDIRPIHSMLFNIAYSKDLVKEDLRQIFNDLELEYETAASERFEKIDVDDVEEEEEEEKPAEPAKPVKAVKAVKKSKKSAKPVEKPKKKVVKKEKKETTEKKQKKAK